MGASANSRSGAISEWSTVGQESEEFQTPVLTVRWAIDENKRGQVVEGQADEEGNFKIEIPYPGEYHLVARGRAGFNEALWTMDRVAAKAGIETALKVSEIDESCIDLK